MKVAAQAQIQKLTPRQREGRAANAVAELLRQTLSVPNIYLHPIMAIMPADVLAVDRAGAGDLHAVQIELAWDQNLLEGLRRKPTDDKTLKDTYVTRLPQSSERLKKIHRHLMSMPAHFRYLAIPVECFDLAFRELTALGLYAEDGVGRLGIILITEKGQESPFPAVSVVPERFRVDPAKLRTVEAKLLQKQRPDIEVRI